MFRCNNFGDKFSLCNLRIHHTRFEGNKAGQEGGAIKWNFYEPQMINITFSNNTAGLYGDEIASVARSLVKIDKKDIGLKKLT